MAYAKETRKFVIYMILLLTVVKGVTSFCTSSSDSSSVSYECTDTFADQQVSITVDVDTCTDKPKVKVNVFVAALGIDWTETFDNSDEIPIPGFTAGTFAGVYLKVQVDSDGEGNTNLKIMLSVKLLLPIGDITVLNEKIAKSDCNDILYWWNSQETGAHVGISAGGVILLILLIVCCCKCCKKNQQQQSTIIMAPSQPAANTMVINNTNQMHAPVMYNQQPPPSNVPYKQFDRY